MNPVLQIEDLSFAYLDDKNVLNHVSLSIEPGQYATLIGHNGSGKSTLSKLIMGLMSGYDGKIFLFGEEVNRKNLRSLTSKVGIVFQNPDNQFVGSTVADDIAFGLENSCVKREEMEAIIQEVACDVGMEKFLSHEPASLSGGQKQRVAIAGVLAMNPSLVIFDEATAMLDPRGKKEIRALIQKMRAKNPDLAILSITHDIEEAAASDRVFVLEKGNILFAGSPHEVFSHYEELVNARLDIPFAVKMCRAFRNQGMHVPENITTVEALEEFLCQ